MHQNFLCERSSDLRSFTPKTSLGGMLGRVSCIGSKASAMQDEESMSRCSPQALAQNLAGPAWERSVSDRAGSIGWLVAESIGRAPCNWSHRRWQRRHHTRRRQRRQDQHDQLASPEASSSTGRGSGGSITAAVSHDGGGDKQWRRRYVPQQLSSSAEQQCRAAAELQSGLPGKPARPRLARPGGWLAAHLV